MRPRNPVRLAPCLSNRVAGRWPTQWLMTDERMGDALWAALRRVPPGGGVVFRHYATPRAKRIALFRRVRSIALARRLMLSVAGRDVAWPVRHGGPRPFTAAAHSRREAVLAVRRGTRALFVSPVLPTRSHPGAKALGVRRALTIGRGLDIRVLALGGLNPKLWRRLAAFEGWGAIDHWLPVKAAR